MNFVSGFDKLISKCDLCLDYIARICTFLVMIIVCANAISNNFWDPIYGSYEYAQLLTCLILALCMAYCGLTGGHVYVTFISDYFSKKIEKILVVIIDIICMIACFFMAVYNWKFAQTAFLNGDCINTIFVPKGPFIICIGIGFFLLAFTYLVRILRIVRNRNIDTGELLEEAVAKEGEEK